MYINYEDAYEYWYHAYRVPPAKTLTHKCLEKLDSILFSSKDSGSKYSKLLTSENGLQLSVPVAQLIMDYAASFRVFSIASVEAFCAVLSKGGCYHLHLDQFVKHSKLSKKQVAIIVDTLVQNYENFIRLSIKCCKSFPFKGKILTNLQYIGCKVNSLNDLISILAACPNLIGLDICAKNLQPPTDQEITEFFREIQKSKYSKTLHSIKELGIGPSAFSIGRFLKLVSLLPNLTKFTCFALEKIITFIYRFETYGTIIGGDDSVSSNNIQDAISLFKQLKGLEARCYIKNNLTIFGLLRLYPNLEEIELHFDGGTQHLDSIANFKNLKKLYLVMKHTFITTEMISHILTNIGSNLQYLRIQTFIGDILLIARYCPNLKFLDLTCRLPTSQDTPDENISKEAEETLKSSFLHLECFWLYNCPYRNVATSILTNAFNIEDLQLYKSPITDEQWTELVENNTFTNLKLFLILGKDIISEELYTKFINSLDKLIYTVRMI